MIPLPTHMAYSVSWETMEGFRLAFPHADVPKVKW